MGGSIGTFITSAEIYRHRKQKPISLTSVWGNGFFFISASVVAACGGDGDSAVPFRPNDVPIPTPSGATQGAAPPPGGGRAGTIINLGEERAAPMGSTLPNLPLGEVFAAGQISFFRDTRWITEDGTEAAYGPDTFKFSTAGKDNTEGTVLDDHIFGNDNANIYYITGADDPTDNRFGNDQFIASAATPNPSDDKDAVSLERLLLDGDDLPSDISGFSVTIANNPPPQAETITVKALDNMRTASAVIGTIDTQDVDIIIGSSGSDIFTATGGTNLFYSLQNDNEGYVIVLTADGAMTSNVVGKVSGAQDQITGFINLIGSGGDDVFVGHTGDNKFYGGAGHDVLVAKAGTDTLNGGDGDDILVLIGQNTGSSAFTYNADDLRITHAGRIYDLADIGYTPSIINNIGTALTAHVDGGAGHDLLVVFGTADLSGMTARNVTIELNSRLILDASQLGGLTIRGDGSSQLEIMTMMGSTESVADLSGAMLEDISEIFLDSGVTLKVAVDELAILKDIAITGQGKLLIEGDIEVEQLDEIIIGMEIGVSQTISATETTTVNVTETVATTNGVIDSTETATAQTIMITTTVSALDNDTIGDELTVSGSLIRALDVGERFYVSLGNVEASQIDIDGLTWTAIFNAGSLNALRTEDSAILRAETASYQGGTEATQTINITGIDASSNRPSGIIVAGDGTVTMSELDNGFTVTGAADTGDTVAVTINAVTRTDENAADGSFSVTFDDLDLTAGRHLVTVTASDAAGNISPTVVGRFLVFADAPRFVDEQGIDITAKTAMFAESKEGAYDRRVETYDATVEGGDSGIFYSISGTDAGLFTIGRHSGRLSLNADTPFDAENGSGDRYSVTITAKNLLGQSGTLTLTVAAENVNEAPTDITGHLVLPVTATSDKVAGTLGAVDPDIGDTHGYLLVAGEGSDDNGLFEINDDGEVAYISDEPPADDSERYAIRVQVTDAGGLSHRETVEILVVGLRITPDGGHVLTEGVSDVNLGMITVTPNVFQGNPTIELHADSMDDFSFAGGTLTFTASADFETSQMVTATFTVSSNGIDPFNQEFVFDVMNLDDESPVFTRASYSASVRENQANNNLITLAATDPDTSTPLTYSLSGTGSDLFSINSSSGLVSLANGIDLTGSDEGMDKIYNLVVTASDGTRSDTANLSVTITNVNDEPTVFPDLTPVSSNNYQATENVNEDATEFIYTLPTATDADGGTITYALVDGNRDGFTFNTANRQFSIAADALDFENPDRDQYVLTFTAVGSDGEGVDTTATLTLTLTVNVDNDNEPPTDITGSLILMADATKGAIAGTLTGIDPDNDDTLIFSLADGLGDTDNGLFRISGNGEVTYTGAAPPASGGYSILVQVIDAGGLDYEKAFTVTVGDSAPPVSDHKTATVKTIFEYVLTSDGKARLFGDSATIALSADHLMAFGNGDSGQRLTQKQFQKDVLSGAVNIQFADGGWQLRFQAHSQTADDDRTIDITKADGVFDNAAGDNNIIDSEAEFSDFISGLGAFIEFA